MKKIMAMYLPQYHEVKENNEWWGKGYTEWTAVKNAKLWYKGHNQPQIPLNNNYYDLSDESGKIWKWQAALAKKFGIDGFCIYHYWFSSGNQLLEKPMEILLRHPEIDLNYCICWANESWTRTWYGIENEILKEQIYGDADEWTKHFEYLLQFFKDNRYIKKNNKPLIHIYHTFEIEKLADMVDLWNKLAQKNGFSGVYIISGNTGAKLDVRNRGIDAYYNFEPTYTLKHRMDLISSIKYYSSTLLHREINKIFKKQMLEIKINTNLLYKNMKKQKVVKNKKPIGCGSFPKWDNTPRRMYKGAVYTHASPRKFEDSLYDALIKSTFDYIYINAWNEWGEGAYIEPDIKNKYGYLKAVKNAKNRYNKFICNKRNKVK